MGPGVLSITHASHSWKPLERVFLNLPVGYVLHGHLPLPTHVHPAHPWRHAPRGCRRGEILLESRLGKDERCWGKGFFFELYSTVKNFLWVRIANAALGERVSLVDCVWIIDIWITLISGKKNVNFLKLYCMLITCNILWAYGWNIKIAHYSSAVFKSICEPYIFILSINFAFLINSFSFIS